MTRILKLAALQLPRLASDGSCKPCVAVAEGLAYFELLRPIRLALWLILASDGVQIVSGADPVRTVLLSGCIITGLRRARDDNPICL